MRKVSGIREWVKHTRKRGGLRRRVNKATRRNARRELRNE
jgi:hypothetical protein